MTNNITQKVFAITAITNMEEQRNPGIVPTINFTLLGCAKTATSTTTTRKRG